MKGKKMVQEVVKAEKQLVLFSLAREVYGIDVSDVREIIRMQPVTKVPKAAFFIEGIINLRGRVIPVVNIRKRFDIEEAEQTAESRIVVVDIEGSTIGIMVDAVTEVIRVATDAIQAPSDIVAARDTGYLKGIVRVDKQMVVLLDLSKLFLESEMDSEVNHNDQAYEETGETVTVG